MTDYLESITENQEEEMKSVNRLEENRFKTRTTVTQERRQLFSKTLYLSSDTNTTCDSTTSTLYSELQRMSELSRAQALRYTTPSQIRSEVRA